MNRLTERGFKFTSNYVAQRLQAFPMAQCLSRLQEYEDAEEEGLIVRLPCKVGDTVYTNVHALDARLLENIKPPYPGFVLAVELTGDVTNGYGAIKVMFPDFSLIKFNFSNIGKTVFLTKEDAEKALAESEM